MPRKKSVKKYLFKRGKHCDMKNKNHNCYHSKCGGGIYGLGFIGALIYYIQTAPSFWMGVLGILKAIVWPAILIYKVLGFLG